MRSITDDHGRPWEAVAMPTKVAHLRDNMGALSGRMPDEKQRALIAQMAG